MTPTAEKDLISWLTVDGSASGILSNISKPSERKRKRNTERSSFIKTVAIFVTDADMRISQMASGSKYNTILYSTYEKQMNTPKSLLGDRNEKEK